MRVAIVGAGMCGAYLASRLFNDGHQVTVFDKSRGSGGRAGHKRLDWTRCDLGATIIPTTEDSFAIFMQQQIQNNNAAIWPNTPIMQWRNDQLTRRYPQTQPNHYVFTPGMSAGSRAWLKQVHFQPNRRITALQKADSGWKLNCDTSESFDGFERVIVTVPLPQALSLVTTHLDDCPSSDEVHWSSCWSVVCKLDQAITPAHQQIYFTGHKVQAISLDSSKPGRNDQEQVWVVQYNNAFSDQHAAASDGQLVAWTEAVFSEVYSLQRVKLTQYHCHYWRFARPARTEPPRGLLINDDASLLCGGDWSLGGSVQAAFIAANQLYAAFNDSYPHGLLK